MVDDDVTHLSVSQGDKEIDAVIDKDNGLYDLEVLNLSHRLNTLCERL